MPRLGLLQCSLLSLSGAADGSKPCQSVEKRRVVYAHHARILACWAQMRARFPNATAALRTSASKNTTGCCARADREQTSRVERRLEESNVQAGVGGSETGKKIMINRRGLANVVPGKTSFYNKNQIGSYCLYFCAVCICLYKEAIPGKASAKVSPG